MTNPTKPIEPGIDPVEDLPFPRQLWASSIECPECGAQGGCIQDWEEYYCCEVCGAEF